MTHQTAMARRTDYSHATDIGRKLESARAQVEKRFLDGGAVLLSVMDVLTKLLGSVDQLTKTLDSGDATGDLLATVGNLSELPRIEDDRQIALGVLSDAGSKLRSHVADMQETMRYLQTFAITVKITGAGIAEFAGFAEEILDRIRSGTGEVNNFAEQLKALEKDLKNAQAFGSNVSDGYAQTVPSVVKALENDARTIGDHRGKLARIATEVSALARGVQGKIATTLSALQIGDITRQRIEHVQSTLSMGDEFLESDDAVALDRNARQRVENIIHHLAAAQMADMVQDFQRESQNVVQTIASFNNDTQQILSLRGAMQSQDNGKGDNFMRDLEGSVSAAHAIVKQVEDASLKANQVSRSTTATATNLLQGIENIRSVKTDIHYMALNTNLRCSRMGEEGRSINVVTAELRFFAAKLDESADAIVNGLSSFEDAAARIAAGNASGAPGLDERLNSAIGTIRSAANAMESELALLSEHGQDVARTITLSMSKLDFQHDLGEVLASCTNALFDLAGSELPDISDLGDALHGIGGRIFKLYTMAQERAIHNQIIPAGYIAAPAPAAAANDDEELFGDALF